MFKVIGNWLYQLNQDQVSSTLSKILTFIGGILVTRGYASDTMMELWMAAAVSVGTLAFGIWKNRPSGTLLAASRLPVVETITLVKNQDQMAAKLPNNVLSSQAAK